VVHLAATRCNTNLTGIAEATHNYQQITLAQNIACNPLAYGDSTTRTTCTLGLILQLVGGMKQEARYTDQGTQKPAQPQWPQTSREASTNIATCDIRCGGKPSSPRSPPRSRLAALLTGVTIVGDDPLEIHKGDEM